MTSGLVSVPNRMPQKRLRCDRRWFCISAIGVPAIPMRKQLLCSFFFYFPACATGIHVSRWRVGCWSFILHSHSPDHGDRTLIYARMEIWPHRCAVRI